MDGIEPDCVDGECLVGFDMLDEEDFRLLEIRWQLVHLSELGLSRDVTKEYAIDRDDLCQLALIEADFREQAQPQKDEHGEGR